MPKDNIERVLKKHQGNDAETYDEIRYEGYGPGGVALIVEALTDNRNRTHPKSGQHSTSSVAILVRPEVSTSCSIVLARSFTPGCSRPDSMFEEALRLVRIMSKAMMAAMR